MNPSTDPVLTVVLLIHLLSTAMMTGLIWFVQIVHYPLMARVGSEGFSEYEDAHTKSTTSVVGPLMLLELASAIYLLRLVDQVGWAPPILGLAALAVIWISTAFVQVPCHRILTNGFDSSAHQRLVRTNWIRTVLWSFRSICAAWILIA
ncbi:MAG: hypothetical protein JJ974_10375 [Phycisphaerales bacterium]|nr:hypothetical protein [Phycisphaerales bacterium]